MEASIIPSRSQEDLKSSQIEMQHFWQFKLLPSNWRGNKWHIQTVGGSVPYSHTTPNMLFSHSVASDSLWPHELWHQASLSCTVFQSFLKLMSIGSVMPSNHLIFCHPLLFMPSIFPSIRVFSVSWLFSGQSIGAPASASVLPMNIKGLFPLGLTGLISLHPRDSQESSPTP